MPPPLGGRPVPPQHLAPPPAAPDPGGLLSMVLCAVTNLNNKVLVDSWVIFDWFIIISRRAELHPQWYQHDVNMRTRFANVLKRSKMIELKADVERDSDVCSS